MLTNGGIFLLKKMGKKPGLSKRLTGMMIGVLQRNYFSSLHLLVQSQTIESLEQYVKSVQF